jgi:hypothetical protein
VVRCEPARQTRAIRDRNTWPRWKSCNFCPPPPHLGQLFFCLAPMDCALTPKNVATGRKPPYNTPAEIPAAPLPRANELGPSLAPRSASSCSSKDILADAVLIDGHRSSRVRSTAATWPTLPSCSHTACPADPPFRVGELDRASTASSASSRLTPLSRAPTATIMAKTHVTRLARLRGRGSRPLNFADLQS